MAVSTTTLCIATDRRSRTEMGVGSETETKEAPRAATSETRRCNGAGATHREVPLGRGAKSRLLGVMMPSSWHATQRLDGSNILTRRRDAAVVIVLLVTVGGWCAGGACAPGATAMVGLTLVAASSEAPAPARSLAHSTLPHIAAWWSAVQPSCGARHGGGGGGGRAVAAAAVGGKRRRQQRRARVEDARREREGGRSVREFGSEREIIVWVRGATAAVLRPHCNGGREWKRNEGRSASRNFVEKTL